MLVLWHSFTTACLWGVQSESPSLPLTFAILESVGSLPPSRRTWDLQMECVIGREGWPPSLNLCQGYFLFLKSFCSLHDWVLPILSAPVQHLCTSLREKEFLPVRLGPPNTAQHHPRPTVLCRSRVHGCCLCSLCSACLTRSEFIIRVCRVEVPGLQLPACFQREGCGFFSHSLL